MTETKAKRKGRQKSHGLYTPDVYSARAYIRDMSATLDDLEARTTPFMELPQAQRLRLWRRRRGLVPA